MAETYTYDRFDHLMKLSNNPTLENLAAAAAYIQNVLKSNGTVYGFMGGYSLILRGSMRHTEDIDVAIGSSKQELKEVIKPQDRFIIPLGPTGDVMKIFTKTGGDFDLGIPEKLVEVDFLMAGTFGLEQDLQPALEIISASTALGPDQFSVLGLKSALTTKLNAHFGRQSNKDYKDIQWLCLRYFQEIAAFKGQLNMQHKQSFIDHCQRDRVSSGSADFVPKIKHVLGVP